MSSIDSTECIHGIENRACDICFPKARPEPVAAPPRTRSPRTTTRPTSLRSTPSSLRTPPREAVRVTGRPADVSSRRVYHVTHLDNLAFIADAGALLAGAEPAVDISAASVRDVRAGIELPNGLTVAQHVPFFAGLESSAWAAIVEGASDPRLAVEASAQDFALLVVSMGAIPGAVIADGDAAHPLTRFTAGEDVGRALVALGRDTTGRALDAEVLVPERVPLEAITVVTVANDRAQRIARQAGIRARVAVHPPWFQPRVEE